MIDLRWYDDDGGTNGVHDSGDELTWWYTPGGPNGRFGEMARAQSFDDFRANGPAVPCPPEIEAQLRAHLESSRTPRTLSRSR